jgi:hypothetical protein
MTWIVIALLLLVPVVSLSEALEEQQSDLVTGTLEELDLEHFKGKIRTDLNKPIFFQIVKPELFQNLKVGERVTVQLDEEGRAIKAIEVPAPELAPAS